MSGNDESSTPTTASELWVVSGRVQGVGYRYFCCREARGLGLLGDVRNLSDGTVELRVVGGLRELGALEERLWQGPLAARVERVERRPLGQPAPGFRGFVTRH